MHAKFPIEISNVGGPYRPPLANRLFERRPEAERGGPVSLDQHDPAREAQQFIRWRFRDFSECRQHQVMLATGWAQPIKRRLEGRLATTIGGLPVAHRPEGTTWAAVVS